MYELLTLGMKETYKDHFELIVLRKNPVKIVSLTRTKNQIINEKGKCFWDIGYVTEVEHIETEKDNVDKLIIQGKVHMHSTPCIDKLKRYFENRSADPTAFFDNKEVTYGFVKVDKVYELIEEENGEKFRMMVHLKGDPAFKKRKILNKDYRWKKYWQRMYQSSHLIETKERYIEMLNQNTRGLYIIMYRHTYGEWIAGMHWL